MRFRFRQVTCNEAWSRVALLIETGPGEPAEPMPVAMLPTAAGPFDDGPAPGVFGPTCPYTRTLKTIYPWKKVKSARVGDATISTWLAEIPETCLWEPIHPFLYAATWQAGVSVVDACIGIRSVGLAQAGYSLNGVAKPLRGAVVPNADAATLMRLRECGCEFVLRDFSEGAPDTAFDTYGPFAIATLPNNVDAAMETVAAAGPTRPCIGMWLAPAELTDTALPTIKAQDPATLFARRMQGDLPLAPDALGNADVMLIDCADLAAAKSIDAPWPNIAVVDVDIAADEALAQWTLLAGELDALVGTGERIGWIVRPTRHE